ncbi:MAG: 16S rRNA (uracil(1498)-N(3))-methyltransferase [Eubacterium sp.]|nr:16S rRNA (uracil(1498)-N(3))-methyltransferase [Eubacterium sp.]
MHQFFIPAAQEGKEFVTILGQDVNHIKNVLRMRTGEEIRVSSENGQDHFCRITEITDEFVQADILRPAENTELPSPVYLFQALPKGDRMETVIQKAVELGVHEIIPVEMKYCVVKLDAKKAQTKARRWQAIAESAAKQSKRSRIPHISEPVTLRQAFAYAKKTGGTLIVPYENERGMAATKDTVLGLKPGEPVSVMIGPEGGFAPEEIEILRPEAKVISLGKRILRTDTAAIAALSVLMLHLETVWEEESNGDIS